MRYALPHLSGNKKFARPLAFALLLALILLLPVGHGSSWAPVFGWGNAVVDSYCLTSLEKTQNVYQVICALDSVLSLARSGSINAGALGVGGAVAPAELLAPIHDTVKTLSDFLTFSIVLLLIEKQSMGMLGLVCIKWAMSLGLFCLLAAALAPRPCTALKKAGGFLCKAGLCVWLILPLTALGAGFIDKFYITPKYEAQTANVKNEIARVFQIQPLYENESIGAMAVRGLAAFGGKNDASLISRARELFSQIKGSVASSNDLASLAMLMFSQIAVLVFVAPALIILILCGLCGIVLSRRPDV